MVDRYLGACLCDVDAMKPNECGVGVVIGDDTRHLNPLDELEVVGLDRSESVRPVVWPLDSYKYSRKSPIAGNGLSSVFGY